MGASSADLGEDTHITFLLYMQPSSRPLDSSVPYMDMVTSLAGTRHNKATVSSIMVQLTSASSVNKDLCGSYIYCQGSKTLGL